MPLTDNAYGLEEIQRTLLDMMKEVDRVCREKDIRYTLAGGTMLGAIRHQGFIPWDDDLDIAFPKADWDRFLQIFPQESERYTVTLTDTWVPRVVPREPINGEFPFIDLFHYADVKGSGLGFKLKVFALKTLQGMLKEKVDYSAYPPKYRPLLMGTYVLGRLFPKKWKLGWYRRIADRWNRGDGTLVHVPDGDFRVLHRTWPVKYTEACVDVPFEDTVLKVSSHYDEMLTRQYGDYMTPPPENKRVAAHTAQRKKG